MKRSSPYTLYNEAGQRLTPYEYWYINTGSSGRLLVQRQLPDGSTITELVSPDGTTVLNR